MTHALFIGDYAYSSWSLRGWLLFDQFGLPCNVTTVDFTAGSVRDQLPNLIPANTVPSARLEDGALVWDSLALAEELHNRYPEAGLWPKAPEMRALARSLAAEMHSGFMTLRNDCPMNTRLAYRDVPVSDDLRADLARIEELWTYALEASGGAWLCGEYSVADAFYAPVAARIAGYDLPVGEVAQAYVQRHLAHGGFRRFRAMGLVRGATLTRYAKSYATRPWPGPASRPAQAVANGEAQNSECPYSGGSPAHLLEMDGKVWGFCNPFCRDKTAADPAAWPAFMEMIEGH